MFVPVSHRIRKFAGAIWGVVINNEYVSMWNTVPQPGDDALNVLGLVKSRNDDKHLTSARGFGHCVSCSLLTMCLRSRLPVKRARRPT